MNDAYFAPSTIRFPYELKKIFDRILYELQYLYKEHPHHFTLDLDQLDRIFEYRASGSYSKEVITRRTKTRPIIFNMRKRIGVYKNKKNLKRKPFLITESLTLMQYEIHKKAKEKFGRKAVRQSDGRIFTNVDNQLQLINSEEDL